MKDAKKIFKAKKSAHLPNGRCAFLLVSQEKLTYVAIGKLPIPVVTGTLFHEVQLGHRDQVGRLKQKNLTGGSIILFHV